MQDHKQESKTIQINLERQMKDALVKSIRLENEINFKEEQLTKAVKEIEIKDELIM